MDLNIEEKYHFTKTLKKARQYNIDALDLDVAFEVNGATRIEGVTVEVFEKMCELVKKAYLKSDDISIGTLASCLINLIADGQLKICELDDYDYHDLIDEAISLSQYFYNY